jgi:hypothetical protein
VSRRNLFDKWPETRAELKSRYYTFVRRGLCKKCGELVESWLSTNRIPLTYDVMPTDDSPAALHSKTCNKTGAAK